jgi:membrane protein
VRWTQFAAKASQVGVLGLVVLLVAALALVFTIDRTLNAIWRVRKRRPLAHGCWCTGPH